MYAHFVSEQNNLLKYAKEKGKGNEYNERILRAFSKRNKILLLKKSISNSTCEQSLPGRSPKILETCL